MKTPDETPIRTQRHAMGYLTHGISHTYSSVLRAGHANMKTPGETPVCAQRHAMRYLTRGVSHAYSSILRAESARAKARVNFKHKPGAAWK
ncbi:hypothetical protein NDU88_000106 [Pleurodeles waltl]|uniref:Uncharacterized protein n=1 Tax=Pleurodeles waltl TaxID=8319 RepID=A0AAV7MFX9_PLEWA|nr:hypothetical protein NDU88_000106 [Pleurodeles waltl]